MGTRSDAGGPRPHGAAAAPDPARLVALLREGDVDAAIDAGLMELAPHDADGLDPASRALLADMRQRLRTAWDARERHRARQARLARRKAERDARRTPPPRPAAPGPGLPATAAAALARAKARAGRS